ncbi:MAG: hypothetical protein L0H19_05205, partial [Salinisphaera sp.]|nr:hypothetical protein [Salinisphaera sp.]
MPTVDAAPAEHAEQEIAAAKLLNVNVAVFDPGIPEDAQTLADNNIFPAVREAEGRYLAVNLRDTLADTGFWGAVRVGPTPIGESELLVTGAIVESNGSVLAVAITARDASGRVWIDETYQAEATELAYRPDRGDKDPFQALYNRIADDLLAARRARTLEQLRTVAQLSKLRFAADLAPAAFDRYVVKQANRFKLVGRPAAGNPMVERIQAIRQRDYALIDALDRHYRLFYDEVDRAYDDWRAASFREARSLNELQRQGWTRMLAGAVAVLAGIIGGSQSTTAVGSAASQAAIVGGVVLIGSGYSKHQQSKIHAAALEELGHSLATEM